MNAFTQCSRVEKKSYKVLIPYAQSVATNGQFVMTSTGRLSRHFQKTFGDVLINNASGDIEAIEIKAEKENKYGNFFLETWSNKKRDTQGWMHTIKADTLWYYFLDVATLYKINFSGLTRWAFEQRGEHRQKGRIWDFEEKEQQEYEQPNDTWGRCVPIDTVGDEVGFEVVYFGNETPAEPAEPLAAKAPKSAARPMLWNTWGETTP